MTVLRIEQILHNFEDQNFAEFLNIEQVNFRMTLVTWECWLVCVHKPKRKVKVRDGLYVCVLSNVHFIE